MPEQAVTVTNNDASVDLVASRTVSFQFDHAALVTLQISRPDGRDLYLVHVSTGQVQEVHVVDANTAATTVYFSLVSSVASAGGTDAYKLHYGYLDRPDLHAFPILSKSQMHPVTGAVQSSRAPFALYDNFTHRVKRDGINFEAYPSFPVSLDATTYAVVGGTWTLAAAGLLTSPAGGGGFVIYRGPILGTVRVRARVILQGGYTTPVTGIAARFPSLVAGTAFAVGHGFSFDVAYLAKFSGGVLGTFTNVATPGTTDAEVDAVLTVIDSGGNSTVDGSINGVALPQIVTSTVGATGRIGMMNLTTGASGGFGLLELWGEVWEGVADADIDVTLGASPGLSFPCPSYPWSRTPQFVVEETSYPSFARVLRRDLSGGIDRPVIDVAWQNMLPESYFELVAVAASTSFGAGGFLFTPPGGSEGRYRITPGTLRLVKRSSAGYSATARLEKYSA